MATNRRAADPNDAKEVIVAVELARCGAASGLVERLTGFGTRWVRSIVRENGGVIAMKSKDPMRWLEESPQRLVHARYIQTAYDVQPANESIGRRLINAYTAYRRVTPNPGLLDINECAQVIDLYQSGNAWVRECSQCQERVLVLSEHSQCPICRWMEREFCRGCGRELPTPGAEGRHRVYCDNCTSPSGRLAVRRRERRAQQEIHSAPRPVTLAQPVRNVELLVS